MKVSSQAVRPAAASKPRGLHRSIAVVRRNGWLLSMTLPGVLILFCFAYLPMFGIIIAFKDYKFDKGITGSDWVGLKNFKYLFASEDAWRITFNTLFLNAMFIVFGLIAAVGIALLMNEVKVRWLNKLFQSALFFPYLLSWVVMGYLVFALLKMENGLVNSALAAVGLEPVQWYVDAAKWPALLVLIMLWKTAGYYSVIYLAGMLGISQEYYEAAKIDGASKWQQIIHITLPLLVPIMTIMTLLQIGRIFYADFGLFFNVTRDTGLLYSTTDVIDTYVFRMLRTVGDVGMASAAGFYQAVVGFILVLLANLIVRKIDKNNALF